MKKKTILKVVIITLASLSAVLCTIALWPKEQGCFQIEYLQETPVLRTAEPTPSPEAVIVSDEESEEEVFKPEPKNNEALSDFPQKDKKTNYTFVLNFGNTEVGVNIGVDESTLKKGPGWLETSALPGEEGVCVIYGHRNRNHLKALKDVEIGDVIQVKTSDGTYSYVVSEAKVLENESELHIPVVEGKYLMLTTCYPFRYSGHAPNKYVVMAKEE